MFARLTIAALILAGLAALAEPAAAQRFVLRGPVFVRPYPRPYYGYGYWYGPNWYGPNWYGPGWYYPGGRTYLVPRPNLGKVKIVSKLKDLSVYVDGGFAGVTGKLKEFGLSPGNHDIELRDPGGRTIFRERVQVILDKTTEIRPNL